MMRNQSPNNQPDRVAGAIAGGLIGGSVGFSVLNVAVFASFISKSKIEPKEVLLWGSLFTATCAAAGSVLGALDDDPERLADVLEDMQDDYENEQCIVERGIAVVLDNTLARTTAVKDAIYMTFMGSSLRPVNLNSAPEEEKNKYLPAFDSLG